MATPHFQTTPPILPYPNFSWLKFCHHQQKIQKMNHFWYIDEHKCDHKCIRFLSGKYTFTPQRWYSRTGKIDILFLRKICLHLVYYMFCSQLDTNLALIHWTIIPMFHFYIPWKQKKTFGFLAFSGSTEMEHRAKMG